MVEYTKYNSDNLTKAVEGLDVFTKNWCMNCAETEKQNDLVFRCGECTFCTEDGGCLIKQFVAARTGNMPIDFGSMSH